MTAHNSNKKENNQSDSIQKFEVTSSHKIDFENIPYLYGMSLEEYKEGLEIHSQYFNQMKKIKQIMN